MYENFISIDNGQLTIDNYLTSNYGAILSFGSAVYGYWYVEN